MTGGPGCYQSSGPPDTPAVLSSGTVEIRSSSVDDGEAQDGCCDREVSLRLPVKHIQEDICSISDMRSSDQAKETGCCKPTDKGKGVSKCGKEDTIADTCLDRNPTEPDCKKDCCGELARNPCTILSCETQDESFVDDCYAPRITDTGELGTFDCQMTGTRQQELQCGAAYKASVDNSATSKLTQSDCKNDCYSISEQFPQETVDSNRPSCCERKALPCCDTSCLDRVALRECESGKKHAPPKTPGSSSIASRKSAGAHTSCQGSKDGKACEHHSRKTKEKYAATLDALGCICRALLALGQESCCLPPGRLYGGTLFPGKKIHARLGSVDSCCSKSTGTSMRVVKRPTQKGLRSNQYSHSSGTAVNTACAKTCCTQSASASAVDSCADACCVDEAQESNQALNEITSVPPDPEKCLSGQEHVILSISGMTCTGCETKLKRALGVVESVKNLKTSLILARAEFDVDLRLGSISEVMKHLERTTEFRCERVSTQGSVIDLISPCDSCQFINRPWPDGVTEMRVVDNNIVSVAFDPEIVGARDLVEKGWDVPLKLDPIRGDPTLEAGSRHVRHVGWMTLLSIGLAIPVLIMAWAPLPKREIAYSSASLGLATLVQLVIAGPFYPAALKSLVFSRMIEMDLLIVLSTSAAYIFSVVSFGYLVAGDPLSANQFFETSTLLVTLIMVGRYVSALARQKAVESISFRSLQDPTAVLVGDPEDLEVDIRLLQYGDILKIAPESRIPTDGTVISGSSEIDESMITGESIPVLKYVGSTVVAGSMNGSGMLHVRLTRLAGDNTVSTMASMVDEAKLSKPKIQHIADQIASYFVPGVVALTIVTFVIWMAVGVGVRKQTGVEATVKAITYAITVLIVSCPCAIGLAVPMVIVIASGIAAERGVVFKTAASIEVAYKTSHVVFDKTGTLTQGKLSIKHEYYTHRDSPSTKSLLLGLVNGIKHPVSMAVAKHLSEQGVLPSAVSDQRILTGKGIEGRLPGVVLRAGNPHWLNLSSDARVQPILSQGYTAFCFTINESLAAIFALEHPLRAEAASTVTTLLERGISVHIVSGDNDGAVRSIANTLKIPSTNVRSRCTPTDKQAYIQILLSQPSTNPQPARPIVIFCGDGTNDAVALSAATIGIHMNEGTEVAKSAADVVLMRPRIDGILTAIDISRKSNNRIRFNFGWSFVYNLFAILLGAGAFVNATIPPEFAGLGELVSVLPVVIAAVAMKFERV